MPIDAERIDIAPPPHDAEQCRLARPEPLTARLHAEQLAEALIDLAAAPRCATGEPSPQPGAAAASTE